MTPSELSRDNKLWKDFIDEGAVTEIAKQIGRVHKKFDQPKFIAFVCTAGFFNLELKDRINAIARGLKEYLPGNYGAATTVLKKAAPRLGTFENWALTSYVELYGLPHFDRSLAALKELTKYGTAEFAIRPFMLERTGKTLKLFKSWLNDPNEHVRRLVAEGTRPRGVWMPHIPAFRENPRPVIKLLDKLRADPSLYVRKAVANNLNDISKDNPELAIATAKRWKKDDDKLTDWIIKHGCRSLLKSGDPRVLEIFGFTPKPKIKVTNFAPAKKNVKIGDDVKLQCEINSASKKAQKLVIDYRVHLVKSNGKSSTKVFKWAEKTIKPNETLTLSIKQSFKKITTRRYYPGHHRLVLIINGQSKAELFIKLMN